MPRAGTQTGTLGQTRHLQKLQAGICPRNQPAGGNTGLTQGGDGGWPLPVPPPSTPAVLAQWVCLAPHRSTQGQAI